MFMYTVSKKHETQFGYNFSKCRPIVKVLSLADSPGNFLCICDTDYPLTSTVLLHYLVIFENPK